MNRTLWVASGWFQTGIYPLQKTRPRRCHAPTASPLRWCHISCLFGRMEIPSPQGMSHFHPESANTLHWCLGESGRERQWAARPRGHPVSSPVEWCLLLGRVGEKERGMGGYCQILHKFPRVIPLWEQAISLSLDLSISISLPLVISPHMQRTAWVTTDNVGANPWHNYSRILQTMHLSNKKDWGKEEQRKRAWKKRKKSNPLEEPLWYPFQALSWKRETQNTNKISVQWMIHTFSRQMEQPIANSSPFGRCSMPDHEESHTFPK